MARMIRYSLCLLLCFVSCSFAAEQKKKNVLFLIADDLNNMLGCYKHELAKTPHIDKLASRGSLFNSAYCTFPLCGPSRNSMLTGLHPNSTGILTNSQIFRQTIPNQLSLSQAFRLEGYFAARIGKMYHYNVPNSIGTTGHDDSASWELGLNAAGVDRLKEHPQITTLVPKRFGGTLSWYASPHEEAEHTDALAAKDAEWILERCAKEGERPFFLAVGFFRPHTPYVSPQKYFDLYPEKQMPVVTGVKEDQADLPAPAISEVKKAESAMSEQQRQQCLQGYLASISFMDAQVGKITAALDRLGLAENTIIVFTSDHGYHMGEHGLWQKQSLFEESARVPLLVVAPGVSQKGARVEAPVSQVDLFPTLTELCGFQGPANLQGQSLVPLLKDSSQEGRGWAITQVIRGKKEKRFAGYSLRTTRYRYTEWEDGKSGRELYDHEQDQKELKNLAEDPAQAATVAQLSEQLHAAIKTTLPPSGQPPAMPENMEIWAPLLTDP
jgi:arylsulfatase A-like enzyme